MTPDRPRWREDFPVRWDEDNYITRRELAKFLTLGSGLLASVNLLIAFVGLTARIPRHRFDVSPRRTRSRQAEHSCSAIRPRTTPASWCATRPADSMRSRRSARTSRAPSCIAPTIRRWRVPATRDRFRRSMAARSPARRPGGCQGL